MVGVLDVVAGPDVGAAGAGGIADRDDLANSVICDACSEQVTAGEGVGVDDGDDRPRVRASELVADVWVGDGQVL